MLLIELSAKVVPSNQKHCLVHSCKLPLHDAYEHDFDLSVGDLPPFSLHQQIIASIGISPPSSRHPAIKAFIFHVVTMWRSILQPPLVLRSLSLKSLQIPTRKIARIIIRCHMTTLPTDRRLAMVTVEESARTVINATTSSPHVLNCKLRNSSYPRTTLTPFQRR